MSILFRDAECINADGIQRADVLCTGETITAMGRDLEAPPEAEIVDARGCYLLPGLVDPHVHVYLPVMGMAAKDDYASASRAALLGGTTTLFDMCGPTRQERPAVAFETWMGLAEGRCSCDWSLHMTVSRMDAAAQDELRAIVAKGVASFKLYLAYRHVLALEGDELWDALGLARELGVISAAHCEDPLLIERLQQRLLAEGKTSPRWHSASRPAEVEAEGIARFATAAKLQGAVGYVVHLSSALGLQVLEAYQRHGAPIYGEALVNHLMLDAAWADRDAFEAAKWVMSPPLRGSADREALWAGVTDGRLATVATDHAPFDFEGQKDHGRADFTAIPSGAPSLEHRLDLLHTFGIQGGRLSWPRLVELTSTAPARLFGIYPQKGRIGVGSDADLTLYDPTVHHTVSVATHAMQVDYSAYEGWALQGRPRLVTRRGEVMVRDGAYVGGVGGGRFLPREANVDPASYPIDAVAAKGHQPPAS